MSTELSPDKNRLLEKLVAEGRFLKPAGKHLDRAVDLACARSRGRRRHPGGTGFH